MNFIYIYIRYHLPVFSLLRSVEVVFMSAFEIQHSKSYYVLFRPLGDDNVYVFLSNAAAADYATATRQPNIYNNNKNKGTRTNGQNVYVKELLEKSFVKILFLNHLF